MTQTSVELAKGVYNAAVDQVAGAIASGPYYATPAYGVGLPTPDMVDRASTAASMVHDAASIEGVHPVAEGVGTVLLMGAEMIGTGALLARPGAAPAMSSVTQEASALVKYDPEFAAQQILGHSPVTPGGRTITPHAAERMVSPPAGRGTMTAAEVDRVLDTGTRIRKVSPHPMGDTVTVQHPGMPGKPQVVVDAASGKRVVTVIKNR
jgi:hypothetical protein